MADNATKHDPLDLNEETNTIEADETEEITESGEVTSAEESTINTDNETASELNEAPEEAPEVDRKHKNRESTSEKAKRAALEAAEKAEVAKEKRKSLDPLRLRSKKYKTSFAKIEKLKLYTVEEAIALVKETSYTKFDGSVEMHMKVKGEAVRGTVVLPNGTGKTKKVAVADDETIEQIAAGKLDFDVLLATPAQMPKLAKYAKLLGPKGLMPSPKAGTVTEDIEKVRNEISGGRVEYRADKQGVVHLGIGKVSFTTEKLVENFRAIEAALSGTKPVSASLSSTMGPGLRIQIAK